MIGSVNGMAGMAAVHEGGCEPGLIRTVMARAECDFLTPWRDLLPGPLYCLAEV